MSLTDVGARVPFTRGDPFFQTTPDAFDAHVKAFARKLGDLPVSFVSVRPLPEAETGFCHRNVAECVDLYGGHCVTGYAFWKSRLFIIAEAHSVWATPTGQLIDPTPAAEGETRICFALDPSLVDAFNKSRPPPNRAMSIVDKADPAAVAQEIGRLSPARLEYEKRRANRAGLDIETHIANKIGRTALSIAVDEFIVASEARDLLVTQTLTRVLSHDRAAFRNAQLKVCRLEDRIRQLLARSEGETPNIVASVDPLADVRTNSEGGATARAPGFDGLIAALLDPSFDVVAVDLASSGPKVLYAGNLEDDAPPQPL
ncbi:hypothetical protein [Bradyrhizobium vignae]|uniref:Uncharacterized protein n=1 Tax=Bradyrhizobium vignae TaxID=1549949 RepID=A0A2U3PUL5_9BRAD|nr:hypothetical protein [Bradyrhizobium vignae]SPP92843.1 protein of unknown function [Bradyrhizobium vignae]